MFLRRYVSLVLLASLTLSPLAQAKRVSKDRFREWYHLNPVKMSVEELKSLPKPLLEGRILRTRAAIQRLEDGLRDAKVVTQEGEVKYLLYGIADLIPTTMLSLLAPIVSLSLLENAREVYLASAGQKGLVRAKTLGTSLKFVGGIAGATTLMGLTALMIYGNYKLIDHGITDTTTLTEHELYELAEFTVEAKQGLALLEQALREHQGQDGNVIPDNAP